MYSAIVLSFHFHGKPFSLSIRASFTMLLISEALSTMYWQILHCPYCRINCFIAARGGFVSKWFGSYIYFKNSHLSVMPKVFHFLRYVFFALLSYYTCLIHLSLFCFPRLINIPILCMPLCFSESPFMQQNLSASHFEVTASSMLPVLFCLAITFIPMGIVFLAADNKVWIRW